MRVGGWLAIAALGLVVVGLLLGPGVAVGQETECLSEVNVSASPGTEGLVDPGEALPVLLVHGFGSSAESMRQLRIRIQGFSVDTSVSLFDYSPWALEWVVHPEIGDRLGEAIRCLADTSLANGGPGRVAVMAHSMGGLAVREALGGDPGMGDQVAVVVTFGTPFAGSNWARDDAAELGNALLVPLLEIGRSLDVDWVAEPDQLDRMATSSARAGMTPGSAELAALPAWPENVAVFNDAGQFKIEKRFFFWTSEEDYGDLVVDQPSATSGGQTVDQLGGSFTSECRAYIPDDILNGFAERAVQLAFLTYVIDQDPLFPYCNHFWLTNHQQLVDDALAQLAAASTREVRRPLLIHGDGIGGFDFLAAADDVIDGIASALGPADEDTSWQVEPCSGGFERNVSWDGLTLHFDDIPGYRAFRGWRVSDDRGLPGEVGIRGNVSLGMSWSQLNAIGAEWDEFYDVWEIAELGLIGLLSSGHDPQPDAVANHIGAGVSGFLGC